jgi:hypothetical protein
MFHVLRKDVQAVGHGGDRLIARAVKAIIGAVYSDGGYDTVRRVMAQLGLSIRRRGQSLIGYAEIDLKSIELLVLNVMGAKNSIPLRIPPAQAGLNHVTNIFRYEEIQPVYIHIIQGTVS